MQKVSFIAVAALAAGLSLTACSSGGSSGNAAAGASASSAAGTSDLSSPASNSGSSAAAASDSGSGSAANAASQTSGSGTSGSSSSCKTSSLTFSKGTVDVVDDYNHVTIKLTNSGSATCSMRGFPGVDLKGRDGTTSAQRSQHTPSTVNLAPGQSAAFDLEVLQNNTGGSGVSFDQTVITPPNETHPQTMQLGFNLPVQADGNNTPAVIVNEITSAS